MIWPMAFLLSALAGCSGNRAPILGPDLKYAALAPTVTAVAPINGATGVPINNTVITAAFSEPMAPITGGATFTVTCAIPANNPVGTVSLDATDTIATFTLAPATTLAPQTLYTATVTGARSLASGLALARPYAWQFTTGLAPDTTRPQVALTVPATTNPGPTAGVPTNTAITAVFTKEMDPSTITAASFTMTTQSSGSPAGEVSYVVGSQTAVFTPAAALAASTTYTATITTAATDLAGNALAGNQPPPLPSASNYVWTFTTSAAPDLTPPMVILTSPVDLAAGVQLNSAVSATFSKAMNPLTITTATFTLQASGPPSGPVLQGEVIYDAATQIATFTPLVDLAANTTYTATISGPRDLAGNALVPGPVANPWTFTTGTGLAQGPVALGSADNFGIIATVTITNTGSSTVNGDVSLDPGTLLTGSPLVNGTLDVVDAVSAQANADLATAYSYAWGLAPGTTVAPGTDLGSAYSHGMPPGTYTSSGSMLVSTTLVLDGGGNANAVWVFQIGSGLSTTADVVLANGAQAKNIFWVTATAMDATIGSGTTFNGTVMAGGDISAGTGAVVNGRLLAENNSQGTVALQTTTINVPGL
jgi:hypothetical protein